MADSPDREQAMAALRRVSSLLLSVAVLVIFVLAALAVALFVFNPLMFQAAVGSPQNAIAEEATVFESTTTAAGCTPDATNNASVKGYRLLGARHLSVTGNVSLPDASATLTKPTIRQHSPGTFVLAIDHRETDAANRDCRGLARYTAKVELPYGVDEFELVVRHGENRTLRVVERS